MTGRSGASRRLLRSARWRRALRRFGRPRPERQVGAVELLLRLPFRRQPLYAVSCAELAERQGVERREGQDRQGPPRRPRAAIVDGGRARRRRADRGRPVHRLLGLPRPADRAGAAAGYERLEPLAAVRPRDRRADGAPGRPDAVHPLPPRGRPAGNGAFRCSTASATATSTPAAIIERRRGRAHCCWPTSTARRWPSRACCASPPGGARALGQQRASRWACPRASSSRSNRPAST